MNSVFMPKVPRVIKYIIAGFLLSLLWILLFGGGKAHAQTTCPADVGGSFSRWGNNKAGFGGLVIETKVRRLNGSESHFNTNVEVQSTDARGLVNQTNTTIHGYAQTRGFTTGSNAYRIGGNSNPCTHPGVVMLGIGTTPPSRNEGNWGNGWVLDCTNSAGGSVQFAVVAGAGPSGIPGHWEKTFGPGPGGGNNSGLFHVDNGGRGWVQFTWVEEDQTPPPDDTFLNIYISGYSGSVTMGIVNSSDGSPHDVGRCTNRTGGVTTFTVNNSRTCSGYVIGPVGIQTPNSVSGFDFTGWSGCNSTNGNICYVEKYESGTKSITAHYVQSDVAPTFTVTANCSEVWIQNLTDPDHSGPYSVSSTIDSGYSYSTSGSGTFKLRDIPTVLKDASTHEVSVTVTGKKKDGSSGRTTNAKRNFGPCDTKPTISITGITCPAAANENGSFTITTSDPDTTSTYPVFYRIGTSGSWQSASSPSATITIPSGTYSPYDYFQIEAFADGILPNGSNAGSGSRSWAAAGNYGIGPGKGCLGRSFTANPDSDTTIDSIENPTSATFSGSVDVAYVPSDGNKLQTNSAVLRYFIKRVGGVTTQLGTRNLSPSLITGNRGAISPFNVALSGLNAGDEVCSTMEVSPSAGTVYADGAVATTTSGLKVSTPDCKSVSNTPYLKIYGADVFAGGAFAPNCNNPTAPAKIDVFGSGTRGSSTNYAAFATGDIIGLATAVLKTGSIHPLAPNGFSFGNVSPVGKYSPSTGTSCLPDYLNNKNTATPVGNVTDLQSRLQTTTTSPGLYDSYIYTAAVLPTTNLPHGARKVVYVDGTLTITGNITYNDPDGRGTNKGAVQSLFIVARNINISPNVTQLDGVYIAQPRADNSDGLINTCFESTGLGPSTFTVCNKQLVINGSFAARKINFYRTLGSLREATVGELLAGSSAAEIFRFSPDMYLVGTPFGSVDSPLRKYDSFADLPPNL